MPPTMRRPRSASTGFTLIEMAVVLMIVGLLAGGALYGLNARDESNRLRETQNTLGAVTEGLTWFVLNTSRLPCPDTTGDGREDQAGTTCSATVGAVPYLDLDLTLANTRDGWGGALRYVVDPRLADEGTLRLVCPEDMTDTDSYAQVNLDGFATDVPETPAYLLISHGANGTADASAQAQANATNVAFSDTFYETSTQAGFDEMVRYRTPAKILIDTGCQLAVLDPTAVGGTPPPPPPPASDLPCISNVFGGGMSSTGQGGIELNGNPDLYNMPSTTLTTVELDKPNWKFQEYSASGSPGETLDMPDAPANSSDIEYVAGQWPDVHRTLTESGDYKEMKVTSNGSLTIDSADGTTVVLNVKDEFKIEGASQLIIEDDTVIYADDFEVKGSSSVVINNGSLTIILSGKLTVEGAATLNATGGASSGDLVVLAEDDVEIKGSGRTKGYIYSADKFEISGSGSVEGSIVGDEIEMKGSASLTYSDAKPNNVSENCP